MIVLEPYLERLGMATTGLSADTETLHALHQGHVFNIPFENLDICLGKKLSLAPEDLFRKLVTQKRGGYCFELNGLFYRLLQQVGFEIQLLFARVWYNAPPPAVHPGPFPPRGHQLMQVTVEGRTWLCDVGFGGNGLLSPLPLEIGPEIPQFTETFRLIEAPPFGTMLQYRQEDEWKNLYSFERETYYPEDYTTANYFYATSPESPFTRGPVCTKPTPTGRIILHGTTLKTRSGNAQNTLPLKSPEEYLDQLKQVFDLDLTREDPLPDFMQTLFPQAVQV